MKTILLLLVFSHCSNADLNISAILGGQVRNNEHNLNSKIKEKIGESINYIKDAIKSDTSHISIMINSASKINQEIKEDVQATALNFSKIGEAPHVSMTQLVNNAGYSLENYYLTTSDGYILNIFRIPKGKQEKTLGKVVLLQHGLLLASTDFVLLGPDKGLAYILADAGFDVWMSNARGNIYSRNHTIWNPDIDAQFWKFSWHEIGIIDLPETIDFILNKTGKSNLYHIGHSQGTTIFYVMASMKPEYNAKIKHHISLGPVGFMGHVYCPLLRLLAPESNKIGTNFQLNGINEFLRPKNKVFNLMKEVVCSNSIGQVLCKNGLFTLMGFSPKQLNISIVPLIMSNYPAGASIMQIMHYAQEVNSGRFRQYDHGAFLNGILYGQVNPPDYDLLKITAPVTLLYSSNDWFAAVVDVENLAGKLGNLKEKYLIPILTWNHVDYIMGNDAPSLVYNKIIQIFSHN